MAKIKIMQLLCPMRHCLVGLAYDPETTTNKEAVELLKKGIKAMNLNRWCGLCGSRNLCFETGATVFDSMAEAGKFLVAEEKKNLATRAIFDSMRRAAKNN